MLLIPFYVPGGAGRGGGVHRPPEWTDTGCGGEEGGGCDHRGQYNAARAQ